MTPETKGAACSREGAALGARTDAAPRPLRPWGFRKPFVMLAAILALAGTVSGCTASRNDLGTHDSACFRVLPEALAAVHDRGHLAGERYLPPRELIVSLSHVVVPDALVDASKVATCLVAFRGNFTSSNVEKPWAPTGDTGRIAIVIVRQRDLMLLATVVLGRIPPRLVFAHVFPRLH